MRREDREERRLFIQGGVNPNEMFLDDVALLYVEDPEPQDGRETGVALGKSDLFGLSEVKAYWPGKKGKDKVLRVRWNLAKGWVFMYDERGELTTERPITDEERERVINGETLPT